MEKKTFTFYGNSSHTSDIALMTAIEIANKGYKTAIVEMGEKNAQIGYQLGVEEQRTKTIDYYFLNHKKQYHVSNCLITPGSIAEDFLTDKENAIKHELKKLPESLSMLIKKAQPEDTKLKEEEWQSLLTRLKNEIYEDHDILIIATGGRMFSYDVFFPAMHSDEIILVLEDKPEDLRGLNQFALQLEKIKKNTLAIKSLYLNHGINVNENDFRETNLNVIKTIKIKSIQELKLNTWGCYSNSIKEIEEVANELIGKENKSKKTSKFKLFTKDKKK